MTNDSLVQGARAAVDEILTTPELAAELKVPEATIHQWRHRGVGPRGIKVGKYVRYRRRDVDEWLDARADQPRGAA